MFVNGVLIMKKLLISNTRYGYEILLFSYSIMAIAGLESEWSYCKC